MEKKLYNLLEEQGLQIWIEGLADVLQYLTLTDSQGYDKECRQCCFTVAGVRELLQSLLEERKTGNINFNVSENEEFQNKQG